MYIVHVTVIILLLHLPGHMQMVSMVQTQREHTKLERMLLQQQREMRKLQKAHEVTNAGMLFIV